MTAALATSNAAPTQLVVDFELSDTPYRLALYKRPAPAASAYRAYRLRADGSIEPTESNLPDCLYEGQIVTPENHRPVQGSYAAVDTCLAPGSDPAAPTLRGTISLEGQLWAISPRAGDTDFSDGVDHDIVPTRAVQSGRGAELTQTTTVTRVDALVPRTSSLFEGTPQETKYIELLVVNDARRVEQAGGLDAAMADSVAKAAELNAVIANTKLNPRIRVVLTGQVSFDVDPYLPAEVGDDEVDSEDLLTLFNAWAAETDLPRHDLHALFSGFDFDENVAGKAPLGGMCAPPWNGLIAQLREGFASTVADTAAHEIGHTLGMVHDGQENTCGEGFLMAPVAQAGGAVDPQFSPCSHEDYAAFMEREFPPTCMDNYPNVVASDLCGDGVTTGAEECDCGESDCSELDPCCDGSTCRLSPGAECSPLNGDTPCCVECRMAKKEDAIVCRPARDACDTEEVCSGYSVACPGDVFPTGGGDCTSEAGNSGTCFAGSCWSRGDQCERLGPAYLTSFSGPDESCEFFLECGAVHCVETEAPGICISLTGDTLDEGIGCGLGMQCSGGVCVESSSLDECPEDDTKTGPGVCGCGVADTDGDNDGTPDCIDYCPEDAQKTEPLECGCGAAETDTDADGTKDCVDECPADPTKVEPEACGCGTAETDTDGDETPDCIDQAPENPVYSDMPAPEQKGGGAGSDSGCGCRAAGQPAPGGVWALLSVGLLAWRRRRRVAGQTLAV